jgi:type IV secretory pathway TrbF-like protein
VDEKGQMVQLGIPQDLLAYTPDDAIWLDMLARWVRWVRWRGSDPTLARREWTSAYRHTCSPARRLLQAMEEKEQPFKPSKKLTAVELKSITKTPAPQSYQVLWSESTTDGVLPSVATTMWTGTFSTGRIQLKTLVEALDNRLGLCVTAFDISQNP